MIEKQEFLLSLRNLFIGIPMQIRVLYNKSCKICRKEIDHYKKYSDKKISWIDILNDKEAKMLTSKN